jgi:ABC-type amino acid transport substrate-binding protein
VVLALAAVVTPACGLVDDDVRSENEQTFVPARAGVLTVATDLPAPGFWTTPTGEPTDDPAAVSGGFEWAIARELADGFGLRLEVVDVPFASIVDGDLGGADLAMAQVSVTDERGERLDFSIPYLELDAGVVARAGAKDDDEVTDLRTARERTWAVVGATTDEELVTDEVRPDDPPVVVASEADAVAAVAAGDVDLAAMDLPTALVLAGGATGVTVVAVIRTDEEIAAALAHGAPEANVRVVDAALRAMHADGRLDDAADEWLRPADERDPDDLPVIRIR